MIKDMKRIHALLTMVAIAMLSFTFTSCDEDERISEDLSGFRGAGKTWQGTIEHYYYDRWGLTGNTYRTTMFFSGDSYNSGTGYEVDYDIHDPYNNFAYSEFTWSVSWGTITLRYADTGWRPVHISDYTLDRGFFEGYIDDGYSDDEIYFSLKAIREFNWDPYWRSSSIWTRASDGETVRFASKGVFAK